MSSRNERQPWLLRFLDTFLQEQSIKWMLAVGMLILLGSSLMLVTSHWDSYTPVWKLLVLLGYTAGLHIAGQVTWHSLGLQRTGTGLMAICAAPMTSLDRQFARAVHLPRNTECDSRVGQQVPAANDRYRAT